MSTRKMWIVFLAFTLSVVVASDPKESSEIVRQMKRSALASLPAVDVNARLFRLVDDGGKLQVVVELRLRQNGIPISKDGQAPLLQFYSSVVDLRNGSTLAKTGVELFEMATLARNGRTTLVRSWWTDDRMEVKNGPATFEAIRDLTLQAVDEFCNDFPAANPKP